MSQQEVDVSSIIEQQKLNGFLVALVVGSWVITFFDGFDMNVISFAAPYIAPEFHLDKVMMGKLFSIGLAGTMVGGFLFGYLGDRIGRRPSIIAATVAFSVLTMAIAFSKSYEQLLALRFLDGIAIGGMLPLSWALNIEYAPKRFRSTIVTVVMVGYSLGTALGGPVTVWLAPKYGWGSVFLVGGSLSLLSAIGLIAMLPESVRYLASQGGKPDTIVRTLRRLAPDLQLPSNPRFVVADEETSRKSFNARLLFENELRVITPLLWIAYIFSSMTAFFLATWTPLVFEALGFSRSTAAFAATVNSAFGALGGLSLMRFTDRFGAIAITVMPLLAIPAAAGCRVRRSRVGRFSGRDGLHHLVPDRRPFRTAQHRRHLLPECLSQQRHRLGHFSRQDRIDRRPLYRGADPRDQPAGAEHLCSRRDLSGGVCHLHSDHRQNAHEDSRT